MFATIPLAALFDLLTIWQLYAVALAASTLTVFFDVAYQSYLPTLVAREELIEGNAKLTASASVAEVGSFSLSGWLVQLLSGPGTILIDAGILGTPLAVPDITREEVARAAGAEVAALVAAGDRGAAVATMAKGATALVGELFAAGRLHGILGLGETIAEPTLADRDYVHLEDSPVRVLLDLVDHVSLEADDRFVDLGSGLGRAAILVHWLTGVSAEGIEVQPAYCAYATALVANLGLERVHFQRADASEADLSRGTVYYLFTPFKGRILRLVWQRLEQEAQSRSITVCTYGAVSLSAAHFPSSGMGNRTPRNPHAVLTPW